MDESLLKISGMDVFYRDVQVLHDISLDVAEGEITTVIGPNGAGKSTLLRTITGFEHPTAGSIRFDGNDIGTLPPEKTVRLGLTIVPEGARVFADMSVLDNLKMGSYIKAARQARDQSLQQVFTLFPRLS